MLYWVYTHHILLVMIALCAGFAAWKGGWAERIGAFTNLIGSLIYFLAGFLVSGIPAVVNLGLDLTLAVIFLALALRFASLWLGAAMLLQAGQFSLQAFYFVTERPPDNFYSAMNNGVSWAVVLCIAIGVAAAWRRRAAGSAEPEPPHLAAP